MQQTRAAPPATLDAVLERITYANEETSYTVARVATARSSDLLTVVGALLGAQPAPAKGARLAPEETQAGAAENDPASG
jgi:hypothetical protein